MSVPKRLKQQANCYALVDGIPFEMPVTSERSQVLIAAFLLDAEKAKRLLPGNELHPARIAKKGFLFVTAVSYELTDIGKYIEFIISIACTHGSNPAPNLLPLVFRRRYQLGGYVYDMPVSTEISVKGGKGIWGVPKHRANLDFEVTKSTVSSQYASDGLMAMRVDIGRPRDAWLPVSMSAVGYSQFRGMLFKSCAYLNGKAGFSLFRRQSGRLYIGDHPRMRPLKELDISPTPIFTMFFPDSTGVLDDHTESWFLSYEHPPAAPPEGLESVVGLGLGTDWPPPPKRLVGKVEADA